MLALREAFRRDPFDAVVASALVAIVALSLILAHFAVPPAGMASDGAPLESPYTLAGAWSVFSPVAGTGAIVENDWSGMDYQRSRLPGLSVIGSYRTSDADTGHLTLRLHPGDRVLFRSGPSVAHQTLRIDGAQAGPFDSALPLAPDGVVLAFTNPRLPPTFQATFEDAGTGPGEWSAVALSGALPERPYTERPWSGGGVPRLAPVASVAANAWNGTDYSHSRLPGLRVIGSYRTGDADTGRLTLRLRRGDRVLYRSGPIAVNQRLSVLGASGVRFDTALPPELNWAVLDFSNPRLPQHFSAVFEDAGSGWGEWSAVALAEPGRSTR
jgi:hypothetical protein